MTVKSFEFSAQCLKILKYIGQIFRIFKYPEKKDLYIATLMDNISVKFFSNWPYKMLKVLIRNLDTL